MPFMITSDRTKETASGRTVGCRIGFCTTPAEADAMARQLREVGCPDVQVTDFGANEHQGGKDALKAWAKASSRLPAA